MPEPIDPIEQCIRQMERQFTTDQIALRVIPLDYLPPEIQVAVIEEMNRKHGAA